jgi:hypothetical protein
MKGRLGLMKGRLGSVQLIETQFHVVVIPSLSFESPPPRHIKEKGTRFALWVSIRLNLQIVMAREIFGPDYLPYR